VSTCAGHLHLLEQICNSIPDLSEHGSTSSAPSEGLPGSKQVDRKFRFLAEVDLKMNLLKVNDNKK
jgi:hypothetical protein